MYSHMHSSEVLSYLDTCVSLLVTRGPLNLSDLTVGVFTLLERTLRDKPSAAIVLTSSFIAVIYIAHIL